MPEVNAQSLLVQATFGILYSNKSTNIENCGRFLDIYRHII